MMEKQEQESYPFHTKLAEFSINLIQESTPNINREIYLILEKAVAHANNHYHGQLLKDRLDYLAC